MTREELKRVHAAIERHAEAIVAIGEQIRRHPELGFKEWKTAALVEAEFRRLGLAPRTGLALTGLRADVVGGAGEGPTFALVGELDALAVTGHPEADPSTGAVHACGHNAQVAGLVGAVVFFAVPAEEGGALEWRLDEVRAGRLEFLGGKCELLRLGHFDDMDPSGHAADYEIVDPHLAYVMPARAMAVMVVDLLSDGARGAREVVANARPAMSRESYVAFQQSIRRREVYRGDGSS